MRRKTIVSVLIVLVIAGLVSAFMILKFGDSKFGSSYLLGALLGVANGVVGFLTIEKFIDKSTLVFLKGVFLGMGVRLLLLLGVFVIVLKFGHVDEGGLVSGLMIFYFIMTVLEVIFLNKRIQLRKAIRESKN